MLYICKKEDRILINAEKGICYSLYQWIKEVLEEEN